MANGIGSASPQVGGSFFAPTDPNLGFFEGLSTAVSGAPAVLSPFVAANEALRRTFGAPGIALSRARGNLSPEQQALAESQGLVPQRRPDFFGTADQPVPVFGESILPGALLPGQVPIEERGQPGAPVDIAQAKVANLGTALGEQFFGQNPTSVDFVAPQEPGAQQQPGFSFSPQLIGLQGLGGGSQFVDRGTIGSVPFVQADLEDFAARAGTLQDQLGAERPGPDPAEQQLRLLEAGEIQGAGEADRLGAILQGLAQGAASGQRGGELLGSLILRAGLGGAAGGASFDQNLAQRRQQAERDISAERRFQEQQLQRSEQRQLQNQLAALDISDTLAQRQLQNEQLAAQQLAPQVSGSNVVTRTLAPDGETLDINLQSIQKQGGLRQTLLGNSLDGQPLTANKKFSLVTGLPGGASLLDNIQKAMVQTGELSSQEAALSAIQLGESAAGQIVKGKILTKLTQSPQLMAILAQQAGGL
jgi:hypothetical protein